MARVEQVHWGRGGTVGKRDGWERQGALVGLTGGCVGLALSWLASFPADRVARWPAEKQVQPRLTESLFVSPPWLTLGVPLFVGALTMLAAAYPARCAAQPGRAP
jgi:hypothetical protein